MSVRKTKSTVLWFVTVSLSLFCGLAFAEGMPWNLTEGVTPTSQKVYDLHMTILYIVTVIGIGVFAVMCWSIFHHRKSKGAVAAQFHHSTFAEVTWTIIPILILVAMAVPATKTLIFMEQTGDAEMTIKVTGYQWKWKYDYMEDDISFFSTLAQDSNEARQRNAAVKPEDVENYLLEVDNPVVVPINTKIRILTTAADVNHAWWVPDLGWKRDAIPGFINDNWTYIEKAGTYRGQCAELCGKDHGFMPIVLKAVPKAEYAAWVQEMKGEAAADAADSVRDWAQDELIAKGEEVYNKNCGACHMATGEGVPGMFPSLAGSSVVNGPADEFANQVLNGKNLMPPFKDQLNDADIAAAMTFVRNSWGNAAQDAVQPAEIAAQR
ncbi:MAG: cytochrome c oxidase subunit II [Gammaproteobacteria bacterium]